MFRANRSNKDGLSCECKICKSLIDKAYYKKNSKKIKEASSLWKKNNPEKARTSRDKYAKANPEKVKAAHDLWRKENPEKQKQAIRQWEILNVEAKRIHRQNYNARKTKNGGKLDTNLATTLLLLQKGKCACCAEPLGSDYHLDHIMPLALGGTNTNNNIQLLHQRCNHQKAAKNPIDFMQSRGFLL